MTLILLRGKRKHLPHNPCSTENTRGIGSKIPLPVKPFSFRNLYITFPVVAYICSCYHHLNEAENLLSLRATSWHEAAVMEESGLTLFCDDGTTAYRQHFTKP